MVYLLGTTNREYVIDGVCLPKKSYNEREVELGKKTVIEIDDVMYSKLASNKIFQALTKSGDILVRDKAPEGQETMPELRQKLIRNRDESAKKIADLEDVIRQLQEGNPDTKVQEELHKANEDLTKELGLIKAEMDNLRKEALKEIADRDTKIKELEALLDKGNGK